MDTKDKKLSDFAQQTVHADWKGRPSPGPRGNSGPDDLNQQGHPESHPEGHPESREVSKDRDRQ